MGEEDIRIPAYTHTFDPGADLWCDERGHVPPTTL